MKMFRVNESLGGVGLCIVLMMGCESPTQSTTPDADQVDTVNISSSGKEDMHGDDLEQPQDLGIPKDMGHDAAGGVHDLVDISSEKASKSNLKKRAKRPNEPESTGVTCCDAPTSRGGLVDHIVVGRAVDSTVQKPTPVKRREGFLETGPTTGNDACDLNAIRKLVKSRLKGLKTCHTRAHHSPVEEGRINVTVKVEVGPKGRASKVEVVSSSAHGEVLADCAKKVMNRIRYFKQGAAGCVLEQEFSLSY